MQVRGGLQLCVCVKLMEHHDGAALVLLCCARGMSKSVTSKRTNC